MEIAGVTSVGEYLVVVLDNGRVWAMSAQQQRREWTNEFPPVPDSPAARGEVDGTWGS